METIEALGEALNKFGVNFILKLSNLIELRPIFKGGVILVSHDERLIQLICKELWLCKDGSVKSIEGGYEQYRKIIEAELEY
jgi:ATP-binding cassette subfamily F protein 3